jgi:hypothetical protein
MEWNGWSKSKILCTRKYIWLLVRRDKEEYTEEFLEMVKNDSIN